MKEFRLEDLTKEGLIELIHCEIFKIEPRRIAGVHWDFISKKAADLMKRGCEMQTEALKIKNFAENQKAWWKANEVFQKGSDLSDEAERFFHDYIDDSVPLSKGKEG